MAPNEETRDELLSDTTRSRRKLNCAYQSLLSLIPNIPSGTRMTRLKILHFHVQYIQHLKALEVAYCPAEHRNKFIPEANTKNQPVFIPDGADEPNEGPKKISTENQASFKNSDLTLPYVNTSTQDMLEMAKVFSREVEKRLEQENKNYRERTTELQQEIVNLNRQITFLNHNNFKLQQMIVPILMSFSQFINNRSEKRGRKPSKEKPIKKKNSKQMKQTIVKMKVKSGELVQLNDPVLSELIQKHASQPNNQKHYKQFGPDQLNTGYKPQKKLSVECIEESDCNNDKSITNKTNKLLATRKRPLDVEELETKKIKYENDFIDLTEYESLADFETIIHESNEVNDKVETDENQSNDPKLDDLETFLTENCYEEVDAYKIPEHETNPNPSSSGNCYSLSKTFEEYLENHETKQKVIPNKTHINDDLATLDIQAILPDIKK